MLVVLQSHWHRTNFQVHWLHWKMKTMNNHVSSETKIIFQMLPENRLAPGNWHFIWLVLSDCDISQLVVRETKKTYLGIALASDTSHVTLLISKVNVTWSSQDMLDQNYDMVYSLESRLQPKYDVIKSIWCMDGEFKRQNNKTWRMKAPLTDAWRRPQTYVQRDTELSAQVPTPPQWIQTNWLAHAAPA